MFQTNKKIIFLSWLLYLCIVGGSKAGYFQTTDLCISSKAGYFKTPFLQFVLTFLHECFYESIRCFLNVSSELSCLLSPSISHHLFTSHIIICEHVPAQHSTCLRSLPDCVVLCFQPTFTVTKQRNLKSNTGYPFWRWHNYFLRAWTWTWNAMYWLGVNIIVLHCIVCIVCS